MERAALLRIVLVVYVGLQIAQIASTHQCNLGAPETNILTPDMRDKFTFVGYPNKIIGGSPRNVADGQSWMTTTNWNQHGYYTKEDAAKAAYLKLDLKHKYYVRAFAVSGYAGGSHKPKGKWYLEGSHNGHDWYMVGIGKSDQWHAPGTYPFAESQIVKCLYPAKYRYYRVIAVGWTNTYMLIQNIGLFV